MIVISLGTNLGNRFENLRRAVFLMSQRCLRNIKQSIVLETEAIVPEGAPTDWNIPFLNMIVIGDTDLSPDDLLHTLKEIEREMGRPEKYDRWSPRVIDLDILFYDDQIIRKENLVIPHPELKHRPFFLHLLSLMGSPNTYSYNEDYEHAFCLYPRIIGVVNATKDSFSDGGKYYDRTKAVQQAAHIDDIGGIAELSAQSTNPNSKVISAEEEYLKLDEILSCITRKQNISLDVYHSEIIPQLLRRHDIYMINSVVPISNDILSQLHRVCLTHSLTAPTSKEFIIPSDHDPMYYILKWADEIISNVIKLGLKLDLILDPGIGFNKTAYQDIYILQHLDQLEKLGCKIMLGHSRKSFMSAFSRGLTFEDRDFETAIMSEVLANKVDYLRVHNVDLTMRALVTREILKNHE